MASRSSLLVTNLDSKTTKSKRRGLSIVKKLPIAINKVATKKPAEEVVVAPEVKAPKANAVATKKAPVTKAPKAKKEKVLKEKAVSAPTIEKPAPKERLQRRNPLGHLLLEKQLRDRGFRGGVSSDKKFLDRYSTDESIFSIRPQLVLQPKTAGDIVVAVKTIAELTKRFPSLSLTPRGAGTGLSGGSLTDSIVIDTCSHLTSISPLNYVKDEVLVTCEAGVLWRNLEATLKKVGFHVPVTITSRDYSSVGGAIGNNAAGAESAEYNHVSDWIESLEVVLHDGTVANVTPLSYKQLRTELKQKNAYATLLDEILNLTEKNESLIKKSTPKTKNNTAGYALHSVFSDGVKNFKKGVGTMNLIPLLAGSQGTLAIVTKVTLRAVPIPRHTTLLVVPIFNLVDASSVIKKAMTFSPLNLEVFDRMTFEIALSNPDFFKKYLSGLPYYRTVLSMYTTYHLRYGRKAPEITLLVTLSDEATSTQSAREIAESISTKDAKARVINAPHEETMYTTLRRASYSLLKIHDEKRRPAAFLEDMLIPNKHIPTFLTQANKLFRDFNITVTMQGHAGHGHFHFYPLIDFTDKTTPALIEKLSKQYFDLATKHDGVICSELNDGILRTPQLAKIFGKPMIKIFTDLEHLFDPEDIFNPGKKVNPRFDVKSSLRKTN